MRRRVVLVALVAALAATSACVPGGGGGHYTVTAYFPRAVSLFKSSEVRVLGLKAGSVKSVEVDGDRVKVEISLKDEIKIPDDVRASIVPQSLIGARYIQLYPAWTAGDPEAGDGHVIEQDHTTIPVEPDEALAALKKFIDSLDPDGLGRLVDNLATDLDGNGESLNSAIKNLSTLVETFAEKDETLVRIVDNFDQFTQALRTRESQIGQVLDAFSAATGVLADERKNLEALIQSLADLSTNAVDLVAEHSARLRTDIDTVTRLAQSISVNLDSVAKLLDSGPILVSGLVTAWNPDLRAFNLRQQFGPLAQQALQPILSALIPGFQLPCIPLLTSQCPYVFTTQAVGSQAAEQGVLAHLAELGAAGAAGAPGGTPVDTMLVFLGAPAATASAGDSSASARIADGAGGVFGFLASAARSLLGVGS